MPGPFSGLTPRTPSGASGLGAVGGARGVGAGVLRYLVEFVTSYDEGEISQLASDLEEIDKKQKANEAEINAIETKREAIRKQLTVARQAEAVAGRDVTKNIKEILANENKILELRRKHKGGITDLRKAQEGLKDEILKSGTLTKAQLETLINENSLTEQQRALKLQLNGLEQQGTQLAKDKLATEQAQNSILSARQNLLPRLGALGLGLVGGIVGAEIFGPLLTVGQETIDKLKDSVINLVDPSQQAAKAAKSLGEAVNAIADEGDLSRLAAAKKHIQDISQIRISGVPTLGAGATEAAEVAALDQQIVERLNQQSDAKRAQLSTDKDLLAAIENRYQAEHQAALANKDFLTQALTGIGDFLDSTLAGITVADQYGTEIDATIVSLRNQQRELNASEAETQRLAQAARDVAAAFNEVNLDAMRDQVSATSDLIIAGIENTRDRTINLANQAADQLIAIAHSSADAQIKSIERVTDSQIEGLQNQLKHLELIPSALTKSLEHRLDALKDAKPSKQTLALAAAIEKLNNAEKQRARNAQLASIAEERELLLLEKRLRAHQGEINLDKYKGKAKLVAMDEIIRRQQQQNEAQERFNKLLDLQYEFSRRIERQQGESIQEFIERRAQENRRILQEAAELQQDKARDTLDNERDAIQLEIDLRENAEKKKELLRQWALEDTIDKLNKQLKASQEHDRQVLEAQRESLQKQLEASRKADQETLESKRETLQKQIEILRENAQNEISQIRETEQQAVASAERRRDSAVATANYAAEHAIAAERLRAETVIKLMDQSEDIKYALAIQGANSLAQLQFIAGQIAGLNYTDGQLRAMWGAYGMDPNQINAQLAKNIVMRAIYQNQYNKLQAQQNASRPPPINVGGVGLADGGIFDIRNSMSLGNDVRGGERGTEWGAVFPNSLVQALTDKAKQNMGNGQSLIDTVNIPSQNPIDDMWRLKRVVREVVREELRRK